MTNACRFVAVCAVLAAACGDGKRATEKRSPSSRSSDVAFQGDVAWRVATSARVLYGRHAGCVGKTRHFEVIATLAGPRFESKYSIPNYPCGTSFHSGHFGRGDMTLPNVGTPLFAFLSGKNRLEAVKFVSEGRRVNVEMLRELGAYSTLSPAEKVQWLRTWLGSTEDERVFAALEIIFDRARRALNRPVPEKAVVDEVLAVNVKDRAPELGKMLVKAVWGLGLLSDPSDHVGRAVKVIANKHFDRAVRVIADVAASTPEAAGYAIGVLMQLRQRLNPHAGRYKCDSSFPRPGPLRGLVSSCGKYVDVWRNWVSSGGHLRPNVDIAP